MTSPAEILDFLSRISFFAVLAWCFFLMTILCAIALTSLKGSFIRRHRKMILTFCLTSFLLGALSSSTPYFLRMWNPTESSLTPLDHLPLTRWTEPLENPMTELPAGELSMPEDLKLQHRYTLPLKGPTLQHELQKLVGVFEGWLFYLDVDGDLRGFQAYDGMNHFHIPLHSKRILQTYVDHKRLFILDEPKLKKAVRLIALDLTEPTVVWERKFPWMEPTPPEGFMTWDSDSQRILIALAASGLWSVQANKGSISWKRPDLYITQSPMMTQKNIVVFEPEIAKKPGSWIRLDPYTGKTLSRTKHVFPRLEGSLLFEMKPNSGSVERAILLKVSNDHVIRMNFETLDFSWSEHLQEPFHQMILGPQGSFYALGQNLRLMGMRIENGAPIQDFLIEDSKPDSDFIYWREKDFFLIEGSGSLGSAGILFFQATPLRPLGTLRISGSIRSFMVFGDWLYFASENKIYAFSKRGETP